MALEWTPKTTEGELGDQKGHGKLARHTERRLGDEGRKLEWRERLSAIVPEEDNLIHLYPTL